MESLTDLTEEPQDCPPDSPDAIRCATPTPNTPDPNPWPQIAAEHCYPKLMAQWTSLEDSLPTHHMFQRCTSPDLDELDRYVCMLQVIKGY